MRVYLAATVADLADSGPISARPARAVTAELRAALGADSDEEMAEYAALVLAAEDSLALLQPEDVMCRVVVAADVADGQVSLGGELARVDVPAVPFTDVVSVHVDSPHLRALISRAVEGDREAIAQVGEEDLLWYDVSERATIVAQG